MRAISLNIVITIILLLWAVLFKRITQYILPKEIVHKNYKYVRLTKYLILIAAGLYFLMRCILLSLMPDSAIHMVGIVMLLAIAIIVTLCFVVISKDSKWQNVAIVFFLLSTIGIGYWANNMITMPGDIYIEKDEIEIRGSYTLNIPLSTISMVNIEDRFPNIAYRDNGISFKDINIGYFKLESGRRCFMYLKNKQIPIIHIERGKDMPVYVNCDTPEKTVELYKKLKDLLEDNSIEGV